MIYRRNGIQLNHTITYLSYIPPWAHDNALDTLASLLFVLFLVSCLSHTLSKVYLTRLRTSRYLLSSARLHVFLLHFFFVTYLHCWLFFFTIFFAHHASSDRIISTPLQTHSNAIASFETRNVWCHLIYNMTVIIGSLPFMRSLPDSSGLRSQYPQRHPTSGA